MVESLAQVFEYKSFKKMLTIEVYGPNYHHGYDEWQPTDGTDGDDSDCDGHPIDDTTPEVVCQATVDT